MPGFGSILVIVITFVAILMLFGTIVLMSRFYRKVEQGQAIVRNGSGGTRVSFSGMLVFPVFHQVEYMDISVKRVEIDRNGKNGLSAWITCERISRWLSSYG